MNPHYQFVALRAEHRCEYCRAPEVVSNFPFEVEHIVALVHGGANAEQNWALACRACKVRKGVYVNHIDPVTQILVRFYHPRDELWEEHFRVDSETGEIQGNTSIGRATVLRLGMNHPTQLLARRFILFILKLRLTSTAHDIETELKSSCIDFYAHSLG